MAKYPVISLEATRDLEEIWDYIAQDSPENADAFLDQLFSKCCEVVELKAIGRKRAELGEGVMSIAHKRYVIFFARGKSHVEIVRILHGARDLDDVFDS
jgi:plasmid stabilization system protein ParE